MGAERLFRTKRLRVLAVLASVAGVVLPAAAFAKQKTATTEVNLRVESSCRVIANPLDFGVPLKGARTATAATTVTLRCTPGVNYRVSIDNGAHFDGTDRRMYGGQANGQVWYVPYRLYHDITRLLPWESSLLSGLLRTMPPTGSVTLPVFGVADLKNIRASEYRDTVTVTLEF
jgi:spore coat protein U-like protein